MLRIIKPGLLDSLQDAGRIGFAASGINPNGVMDRYAMKAANALMGNKLHQGVLEMHFPAPVILFETAALFTLTGADFGAMINDEAVPVNKPVLVAAGTELSFKKRLRGSRCYLSVKGGFDVQPWLDSISTNLITGAGGLNGKRLLKDDCISFTQQPNYNGPLNIFPWRADSSNAYVDGHYLYFLRGPEWHWLDETSKQQFLQEPFSISAQSDRMAIRLNSEQLTMVPHGEMVSSAVTMGTMQLLPNGKVVILMADHQTTGGYPRIGNIIGAHLPKLAQASANEYVHMLHVEQDVAEAFLFAQQEELNILQMACEIKLDAKLKLLQQEMSI